MLVVVEAGNLLRDLMLLLSLPIIIVSYLFISEALEIQFLIFISFVGLKILDIELVSRVVLPRFHAADVRKESFELFDKCKRKVVVTANPTLMVEPFVKDFLDDDKVLGTNIEVNPKTKRATRFVKKPGVLVDNWNKIAVMESFKMRTTLHKETSVKGKDPNTFFQKNLLEFNLYEEEDGEKVFDLDLVGFVN